MHDENSHEAYACIRKAGLTFITRARVPTSENGKWLHHKLKTFLWVIEP